MATVLLIDGDVAVAQSLKDALSTNGIQGIVTGDGTEGLGLARADPPDVIVLCVELSRVSGYSICNKLKKDPKLAAVPLILTSSQATEETFEQHKKLRTRADAYVKKPFDAYALLGVITSYLPAGAGGGATPSEAALEHAAPEVDVADAVKSVVEPTPGPSESAAPDPKDVGLLDDDGSPPAPEARERSITQDLDDLLGEVSESDAAARPGARRASDHAHDVGDKAGGDEQVSEPPLPEAPFDDDEAEPNVAAADGAVSSVDPPESDDGAPESEVEPALPAGAKASESLSRAPDRSPPPAAAASAAAADQLRADNQKLRVKVKQLEQTLHDKELEFNDRLLQESTRSREGVELKKKIAQLEREVSRYQQAEERAKAEASGARAQLAEAQEGITAAEAERQTLSDKLGQLVEKVKTLATERDELLEAQASLKDGNERAEQDFERASILRQKAKKAVDIALQLIDETGLT